MSENQWGLRRIRLIQVVDMLRPSVVKRTTGETRCLFRKGQTNPETSLTGLSDYWGDLRCKNEITVARVPSGRTADAIFLLSRTVLHETTRFTREHREHSIIHGRSQQKHTQCTCLFSIDLDQLTFDQLT